MCLYRSLYLPPSLSHSLTHSLTHSDTHSFTLSHIHSLTHSLTHSDTHSFTLSHTHSLIHKHTLSHTNTLSHTLSFHPPLQTTQDRCRKRYHHRARPTMSCSRHYPPLVPALHPTAAASSTCQLVSETSSTLTSSHLTPHFSIPRLTTTSPPPTNAICTLLPTSLRFDEPCRVSPLIKEFV